MTYNRRNLILGLSSEIESLDQSQMDRKASLNSAYIQLAKKISKLKTQGGFRYDHHGRFGSFTSGSAGIGYEDLYVQYSQGFKAPGLYQLFAPATIGNDQLRPEINHSWETRWENSVFSVAVFQNKLENLITFVSGVGFKNQGRFITEGVEASTDFNVSQFRIRPAITEQRFRQSSSPVLRRPKSIRSLQLAWIPDDAMELSLTYKSFSSRMDVGPVKLNGFETLDLGCLVTINKQEFGIQVLNVLDRMYEELYGYSVMPRSYFIHYGLKF